MNKEQARNYLRCSGMSEEQIATVETAFTREDADMKERYFDTITEMIKDWAYKDRVECRCEAARMKNKLEYFNEILDILRCYYDEADAEKGCPYAE